MRTSFVVISIIFLAFLQWVFINSSFVFLKRVDLLLLGALFFALNNRVSFAISSGLAIGFLKDIFCANDIFFNAAFFGLASWYIASLSSKLYKDSWVAQFILSLIASFLAPLILWGMLGVVSKAPPFFESLHFVIVPSSLVTAFFAPFFFLAMKAMNSVHGLRIKARV